MAESFDAYHEWLGIAPKDQPPNHYRLLGVDLFEAKGATIEHAANQRMALLRICDICRSFSSGDWRGRRRSDPQITQMAQIAVSFAFLRLLIFRARVESTYALASIVDQ